MGRELKRVPLGFDWPPDKLWEGYRNPHWVNCLKCDGHGSTIAYRRLLELASLLMLSGSDAAREQCHPYFQEGFFYYSSGKSCGPDMVELTTALAGRSPAPPIGHDSIDKWNAAKKIIAAAGLPVDWGTCRMCSGEGVASEHQAAYDAWQPTEPPEGPGYQIWETVSEGSPISPVFATPEELAHHMAGTRWGADKGTSYETWLTFITGPGWAPSIVSDGKQVRTGVQAAAGETGE